MRGGSVISTNDHDDSEIPLALMIRRLREEIAEAMRESQGDPLRFKLESVELEAKVAVSRDREAGGGIRFWVVNADAKQSSTRAAEHVVRLRLQPRFGGKDVEVLVDRTEQELR